MGLLSFLKRSPEPSRRDAPAAQAVSPDALALARTRARRRLIGASVLLGLGIVGFPLLFETQPRPVPVDIPIEIPSKDNVAPLPLPPKRATAAATPQARALPPVVTESPVEVVANPASTAAAPASAPASAARARPDPKPEPKPESKAESKADPKPEAKPETKPAAKPEPKPEPKAEPKSEAKPAAKPEPKAGADTKPAADAGRFVVQVGAFADAGGAREARQKAEKLGLKTYTQEVDVAGAKRIRVRIGPYGSRDEAAKVLARLKAAGLPGAVLTL